MKTRKSLLLILLATALILSMILTLGILAVDDQSAVRGDVNGDSIVDLQDLIMMRQYFAAYNYADKDANPTLSAGADVNGDGKVTLYDLVALRAILANLDFPEDPDLPTNPDEPDEPDTPALPETPELPDINLILTPEQIQSYANSVSKRRLDTGKIIEENDAKYVRYTTVDHAQASVWLHVYSTENTTVPTGEYAILKYRLSDGATTSAKWGAYASTEKLTAEGNDEKLRGTLPDIIDDGKWHIAIFKLNTTGSSAQFAADENGDYYANFFRLDFSVVGTGETLDIEYVAFTDDLDKVSNVTGDEKFDTDVFCTHYETLQYKDGTYHSNACVICGVGEDVAHTIEGEVAFDDDNDYYVGKCSVCDGKVVTPYNLYLDAEALNNCVNNPPHNSVANKTSNQYVAATKDDIAFTRLKGVASKWLYFYYYYNANSDKVTGQYFVIKYRLPEGTSGASIASYVGSSTSPNVEAAGGENFSVATYATGGWVIGVYDMSEKAHYGAKEDGTYSAKYLRLDLYFSANTEYYDIAYVGVCDNLDAIYPNIGENTTCHHPIKDYQYTAGTHVQNECAICHAATEGAATEHTWTNSRYDELLGGYVRSCTVCGYEALIETNNEASYFFDPVSVKDIEKKSGGNYFTKAEIMGDDTESMFVRFTGPTTHATNRVQYMNFIKNSSSVNAGTTGSCFIMKYRYSANLSSACTSINIYVSSDETLGEYSNYKMTVDVTADGNWHYLLLDFKNTNLTKAAFSGDDITLLRLDLFGGNHIGTTDYIDIAFMAVSDDANELANLDDDYETWDLVGSTELKNSIGAIATEQVDEEHNNMPYVTLTGNSENYTTIQQPENNKLVYGTSQYAAILYRKNSSDEVVGCRMFLDKGKAWADYYYSASYISDGEWHLTIFDTTTNNKYTNGAIKQLGFDWFDDKTSSTYSLDVAYVKFFNTLDDLYAFYGEYVKTYLGQDNCDHVVFEWRYGADGDTLKESKICKHCGKQIDVKDISFGIALDKVTDSNGTYPAEYNGTIGTAENAVIAFNSTSFNALYPASGLTVAAGQELSVAGRLTINGDIESIWFKVVNASGAAVSDWKECRYSISGSKFAAYADFDGIDGVNLTVVFAVVPAGLDAGVVAYLPIVSVENVSVSAEATEKVTFKASGDLSPLMDNIFEGNNVTSETVMFLNYGDTKTLLYNIDRIISVKNYDGTKTYEEGKDYVIVDGKIMIPEGSSMPCIRPDRYYNVEGNTLVTKYNGVDTNTFYSEGYAMTYWQVWVEYEHSDDWNGYEQENQSDYFADFIEKLMNGEDVTIFYYGDSITVGANSSYFNNYAPYQYGYALMLTNALADSFGYTVKYVSTNHLSSSMSKVPTENYVAGTRGTITYVNTAVGGWTSGSGVQNFEKHVKNYIDQYGCDLFVCAFGMNDIGSSSSVSNIKTIVDNVYKLAPDTSVMLVSTMFYNNVSVQAETRNGNALAMNTNLDNLAATYREDGRECGFTSMTLMSQSILERKEFMDYSGNNVNHPNDFFCRVYAQTIFQTLIGY